MEKGVEEVYRIFDFHGHFLPDMDDGCKTVEESVQVLRAAAEQGVSVMFATPHYYPKESVEQFLQRREYSFRQLNEYIKKHHPNDSFPKIILGAEVAYRQGISREPALEKLCLGNSKYLLLELPWTGWSNEMLREVRNISCAVGLVPIMAHINRYVCKENMAKIQELMQMDVLMQVNCECFESFSARRIFKKLVHSGNIHLLGSDCHNMTTRKPNMKTGISYLFKHRMYAQLDRVLDMSRMVYESAR